MRGETSILDDIKMWYYHGNMVVRLIMLNVTVFLVMNLLYLVGFLFGVSGFYRDFLNVLMVPASLGNLVKQPWSLLTYMFLHEGFFHILFNMITLNLFGTLLLDFIGNRRILPLYLLGGMAGAFLMILAYNVFPVFQTNLPNSYALGASASVMAIMIAMATLRPNYPINLLLLGEVRIKYIALFFLVMDVITLAKNNPGGHIAHLGGALFGFLFIKQLQNGTDWTAGLNRLFDRVRGSLEQKPKLTVTKQQRKVEAKQQQPVGTPSTPRTQSRANQEQARLDAILDKIAETGYSSLSAEEKAFLFEVSRDDEQRK